MSKSAWGEIFEPFTAGRTQKPRQAGLTMVLDKQSGVQMTEDLLIVAGSCIDHYKFGFGTSVFFEERLLQEKAELLAAADILAYPGGTLAEAALLSGRYPAFLRRARELGFRGIEVSDGTISLSLEQRKEAILRALDAGFRVVSEVGKKDPQIVMPPSEMMEQILFDLELGVDVVTVEARESGLGVGVCGRDGAIDLHMVERIVAAAGAERILWEAPRKEQQVAFLQHGGPNVNLGNISTAQVLEVEALRCQLRFETLKDRALQACEQAEGHGIGGDRG